MVLVMWATMQSSSPYREVLVPGRCGAAFQGHHDGEGGRRQGTESPMLSPTICGPCAGARR